MCDKVIAAPATILIYTYTTYNSIGIIGPAGIYIFFTFGVFVNYALAYKTVAVYRRRLQGLEGAFRADLMGIRSRAEQVIRTL